MRDCHSIVGLYTYQNRVPFAPSLRWVSCKERDRLPHEGANFHSSFVHYRIFAIGIVPGTSPRIVLATAMGVFWAEIPPLSGDYIWRAVTTLVDDGTFPPGTY